MNQFNIAAGFILLMSTSALAQSTQGHAVGHAGTNVAATMKSERGVTNSSITTGINSKASVPMDPKRDSSNGSPSAAPRATTGTDANTSTAETPPK